MPRVFWSSLALALLLGCSETSFDRLGGLKGDDDDDDGPAGAQESVAEKALDDEDALAFIQSQCASCHGKGKDLYATWPIPEKDDLNVESLQNMPSIAAAYQALVNKITNAPAGRRPTAMPPAKLNAENKKKLEGLIYWFQLNLPAVVKEAENTYGASEQFGSTLSVNLNYQCGQRADGKTYLFRLFNAALGRVPTAEELDELMPVAERKKPVTDARRKKLSKLVTDGALKEQFYDYGLRIFAKRVGGAGSIKANQPFGLSDAAANDLKDEFYQLVRAYIEEKTYKDILLLNKVKVTSNTFAFYNTPTTPCADPGPGAWGECTLAPSRSNFFGTVGFLRSTPSSFLESNNNYKRGGEIFAILRGERLMAQTDGPVGEKPNPLPTCLVTKDHRVVMNSPDDPAAGMAPRGALSVPREGNVCQGCHLHKQLGVASFVFRPFDENGFPFDAAKLNPNAPNNPYADMVRMATDSGIQNATDEGVTTPVDVGFLLSLLQENEQGHEECITDRTGEFSLTGVQNIGDLVGFLVGDGHVLVHGLARFIPSALSNVSLTNQEIIAAMGRGFDQGKGKLLPVFRSYFESETFSCATGGEE